MRLIISAVFATALLGAIASADPKRGQQSAFRLERRDDHHHHHKINHSYNRKSSRRQRQSVYDQWAANVQPNTYGPVVEDAPVAPLVPDLNAATESEIVAETTVTTPKVADNFIFNESGEVIGVQPNTYGPVVENAPVAPLVPDLNAAMESEIVAETTATTPKVADHFIFNESGEVIGVQHDQDQVVTAADAGNEYHHRASHNHKIKHSHHHKSSHRHHQSVDDQWAASVQPNTYGPVVEDAPVAPLVPDLNAATESEIVAETTVTTPKVADNFIFNESGEVIGVQPNTYGPVVENAPVENAPVAPLVPDLNAAMGSEIVAETTVTTPKVADHFIFNESGEVIGVQHDQDQVVTAADAGNKHHHRASHNHHGKHYLRHKKSSSKKHSKRAIVRKQDRI